MQNRAPLGLRSSTPDPSLLTDDGTLGAALIGSGQPGACKPAQQQNPCAQQAAQACHRVHDRYPASGRHLKRFCGAARRGAARARLPGGGAVPQSGRLGCTPSSRARKATPLRPLGNVVRACACGGRRAGTRTGAGAGSGNVLGTAPSPCARPGNPRPREWHAPEGRCGDSGDAAGLYPPPSECSL